MSIRLSKLAKELNIKISIAVEYLHKNGYEIPFDPNYKIREIEEKLLNEEFNRSVIVDKDIYLDSDSSNKAIMGTKSMSNIFALKELELNSTMNIIGNIDLSSINQQTHSLIKQIEDNNIECQPQNNELLYTANNILDFKIYNTVQQEKKLTEIYLGSTSITWHFTIANYTADCTEAIPFTPFDRVICGLLTINDEMSINEIALILGLNVIDNAENNEYKDIAEYEILIEALT